MSVLGLLMAIPTQGGGWRHRAQHMIPVLQKMLVVASTAADPDPTLFPICLWVDVHIKPGGKEFQAVV